jgi:hypothetical protein
MDDFRRDRRTALGKCRGSFLADMPSAVRVLTAETATTRETLRDLAVAGCGCFLGSGSSSCYEGHR